MTGAATASAIGPLGAVEAEVRSVNHRFLKTSVGLGPGLPPALEAVAEDAVRGAVSRGHVTVTLRLAEGGSPTARIDPEAFAAAHDQLRRLAEAAGLAAPALGDVLAVPGVVGAARRPADADDVAPAVREALRGALEGLVASRAREGERLRAELLRLLDAIAALAARARARAVEVPDLRRRRLQERLALLLAESGVAPDPVQLARECALLADRADVSEELARLDAHVEHARARLAEGGPTGRPLDFLAQELQREANTLSAKSADLELTRIAMDLKSEVERLREQVQNLE